MASEINILSGANGAVKILHVFYFLQYFSLQNKPLYMLTPTKKV